jgi:hypothetical protein
MGEGGNGSGDGAGTGDGGSGSGFGVGFGGIGCGGNGSTAMEESWPVDSNGWNIRRTMPMTHIDLFISLSAAAHNSRVRCNLDSISRAGTSQAEGQQNKNSAAG